jgi:hypothetical protein
MLTNSTLLLKRPASAPKSSARVASERAAASKANARINFRRDFLRKMRIQTVAATLRRHNFNHCNTHMAA